MVRKPIIETGRLRLFEFLPSDASFVLELVNTPKWISFIGDRNVRTESDAISYIQERIVTSYERFGFGLYLVKVADAETSVGMCGLVRREHLNDVDLGFAFLPKYEKAGYASEAALAVLDYARTALRLKRIVAITMKENERSIRLLRKLGLEFEKMISSPGESDLMLYGIALEERNSHPQPNVRPL
jgi:RimJ/RimL family protein N-acetyltransferase